MPIEEHKIYTRTGDKGDCSLADGSRVSKSHLRVRSYGDVDELNCIVGMGRALLKSLNKPAESKLIDSWLAAIQNDLFILGSDLATPESGRPGGAVRIDTKGVTCLEQLIDYCMQRCPPLQHFILPGGSQINAQFHLARTVCRRVERNLVMLTEQDSINPNAIPYINRLSDFFFALARFVSVCAGDPELLWDRNQGTASLTPY